MNQQNQLYWISIEPVYSQGVGNYEMITANKQHIEKFRMEQFNFSKHLVSNGEDADDMVGWEFYEYVYKINNITNNESNEIVYNITLLHKQIYYCNTDKLAQIDYNCLNELEETLEYDYELILDMVYNNVDCSIGPIPIDLFSWSKK